MATEALDKLNSELERQASIYSELRFPKDNIMRLAVPRPTRLPKELKTPIVTVGTSVEWRRQTWLAGLETYYDLSLGYDTAGGITYGEPHLIWMQDGSKYLRKSVRWVRSNLGKNERPATQYDGIALAIATLGFRDLLINHAIDLPGTTFGSDRAPYLHGRGGRPELHRRLVDGADPDCGSATCGS